MMLTPGILAARVKKSSKTSDIKFKIRCNRFLYTLVLKDSDKADKLKQSLPPGMHPTIFPNISTYLAFLGLPTSSLGVGVGRGIDRTGNLG